jgi:hypothetical protein
MDRPVADIVIVGGGTAGWLAACLIAARAERGRAHPIRVTLVESPDVATIGVGEGTWPTMRHTLELIGISETEFLLACDASFKQGSRFDGWRTGAADESYLHPFTAPLEGDARDVVAAWAEYGRRFADAVSVQGEICRWDLAPRQRAMPDYKGSLDYAYHLNASKFAMLLMRHATERLGVRHIRDHVVAIDADEVGDIAALRTRASGVVAGDLFLDCSGHTALLIGGHYGVGTVDRGGELFNDRALAVQVPVSETSAIASQTIATAHAAGWIWDIGLPTRRGIGCVYSSAHLGDDAAADTLTRYLRATAPDTGELPFRQLSFQSHHRQRFWERNCLAVGLSAGFLEPLEASAIVLIELSLDALLRDFPATRGVMDAHAVRFNTLFRARWDRIVEFLKLHYVLSVRDEPYWRDHRDPGSIPPRLTELLELWRDQPPSLVDFSMIGEMFPASSYQYVLYGTGFPPPPRGAIVTEARERVDLVLAQLDERRRTLVASLPTNRAYLDALRPGSVRPAME